LNGIPALSNRPDLADRAITLFLKAIPNDKRRTDEELWCEFDRHAPEILGALLDGVSAALRNLASVKLQQSSRMSDFARWTQAAESGLGFESGSILAAYLENRKEVFEATFEADGVAVALSCSKCSMHPSARSCATHAIGPRTPQLSEAASRASCRCCGSRGSVLIVVFPVIAIAA
jgi:hypothetical protein